MSEIAEIEAVQLLIEELREQLNTLRISEAVSVLNRETKQVSFVTWIQELMGEAKGKTVHNYLSQIETLSKVNGWTDEGFDYDSDITGLCSTVFEWTRTGKRWLQLWEFEKGIGGQVQW